MVIAKLHRGAIVAIATLSLVLLAGCTASADFSDTSFACSDGKCPNGFNCVQLMCVSELAVDAGSLADATVSIPDAMPLVACDVLFGEAPGYQLCSEDAVSCSFNVNLAGETCTIACQRLETTCLAAFDNETELCVPIEVTGDTCDLARQSEICVCARP